MSVMSAISRPAKTAQYIAFTGLTVNRVILLS